MNPVSGFQASINHINTMVNQDLPPDLKQKVSDLIKDKLEILKNAHTASQSFNKINEVELFGNKFNNKQNIEKYVTKIAKTIDDTISKFINKFQTMKEKLDLGAAALAEFDMGSSVDQEGPTAYELYIQKEAIGKLPNELVEDIKSIFEGKAEILPLSPLEHQIDRNRTINNNLSFIPLRGFGADKFSINHMQKRILYFNIVLQQCKKYEAGLKEDNLKVQGSFFKANTTQESTAAMLEKQKVAKDQSRLESAHISIIPQIPVREKAVGASVNKMLNPSIELSKLGEGTDKYKTLSHISGLVSLDTLLNSTDLLPWYVNAIDEYSESYDRDMAVELMNKVINGMSVEEATEKMCQQIKTTLEQLSRKLQSGVQEDTKSQRFKELRAMAQGSTGKKGENLDTLLAAISGMKAALDESINKISP